MSDPQTPKKPRGCFFYGCITCLALALLAVIAISLFAWFGIRTLNTLVTEYTETIPVALPKTDMSPEELATLKARVADFVQAPGSRTNIPPLVLTSREINALLQDASEVRQMRLDNKFYVDLEGNEAKTQVSLSLDQFSKFPLLHTAGRYLNGTGDLSAGISNAVLTVNFISFAANGKTLPPQMMITLQSVNFADSANLDPTNTAAFRRIDSIEIKDSTLIIKAKTD
jgi:hypothetical protein